MSLVGLNAEFCGTPPSTESFSMTGQERGEIGAKKFGKFMEGIYGGDGQKKMATFVRLAASSVLTGVVERTITSGIRYLGCEK